MLCKAVGAEHALRPFPVLCDDGEIFAARIDGKVVQNSISRCVPPRFRMVTRFTCSGSSPAMFSLHSTRQMPPEVKIIGKAQLLCLPLALDAVAVKVKEPPLIAVDIGVTSGS